MTMSDCAALDIHDVRRQPKLLHDRKGYGSESLVDFNTIDIVIAPACACESLLDSRDRPETKHSRLDRGDAVRHETCDGCQTAFVRISFARQHHRRCGRVQAWGITCRDRAAVAEDRLQLAQVVD